jgi:hypothetical protein
MDVEDLAPALLSIARVCQRANEVLNTGSRLDVKVSATMKQATFHVDLRLAMQSLTPLLPTIMDANQLAEWIFGGDLSVLGVWRRFRGSDPNQFRPTPTIKAT